MRSGDRERILERACTGEYTDRCACRLQVTAHACIRCAARPGGSCDASRMGFHGWRLGDSAAWRPVIRADQLYGAGSRLREHDARDAGSGSAHRRGADGAELPLIRQIPYGEEILSRIFYTKDEPEHLEELQQVTAEGFNAADPRHVRRRRGIPGGAVWRRWRSAAIRR